MAYTSEGLHLQVPLYQSFWTFPITHFMKPFIMRIQQPVSQDNFFPTQGTRATRPFRCSEFFKLVFIYFLVLLISLSLLRKYTQCWFFRLQWTNFPFIFFHILSLQQNSCFPFRFPSRKVPPSSDLGILICADSARCLPFLPSLTQCRLM